MCEQITSLHLTGWDIDSVGDIIKFTKSIIRQEADFFSIHAATDYSIYLATLYRLKMTPHPENMVRYLGAEPEDLDKIFSDPTYYPDLEIFSLSVYPYKDGKKIAQFIRNHPHLEILLLINIGLESLDEIVEALQGNDTLTSLILTKNNIQDVGGLADLMRTNVSIVSISLSGNPLYDDAGKTYIWQRLDENKAAAKNRKATLYSMLLEACKDEL